MLSEAMRASSSPIDGRHASKMALKACKSQNAGLKSIVRGHFADVNHLASLPEAIIRLRLPNKWVDRSSIWEMSDEKQIVASILRRKNFAVRRNYVTTNHSL